MINLQFKGHDDSYVSTVYRALALGNETIKAECNAKIRNLSEVNTTIIDDKVKTLGHSHLCDSCRNKNACRDLYRAERFAWEKLCMMLRAYPTNRRK